MNILIYILPFLFLIRILNSYRIKNLALATQNKVSELRNNLYLSAINGKVSKNHPAFQCVDQMIEYTQPHFQKVNIWVYLYKSFISIKRPHSKTDMELSLDLGNDQELKKFYDRYADLAVRYTLNKNAFSLFITYLVMHISKHLSRKANVWISVAKRNFKYQILSNSNGYSPSC